MTMTATERAFAIPELLHHILTQIDGEGAIQTLFAIQRVSTAFKDTIGGSTALRIRMGLEHGSSDHDDTTGRPSAALIELGEGVNRFTSAPFYAAGVQGPGLEHYNPWLGPWTANVSAFANRIHHCCTWRFTFEEGQWKAVIGMRGKKWTHTTAEASWRNIKLFEHPQPLTLSVQVHVSPHNRRFGGGDHYQRDIANVEFASAQGTLGRFADVLARIEAERAAMIEEPPRGSHHGGIAVEELNEDEQIALACQRSLEVEQVTLQDTMHVPDLFSAGKAPLPEKSRSTPMVRGTSAMPEEFMSVQTTFDDGNTDSDSSDDEGGVRIA